MKIAYIRFVDNDFSVFEELEGSIWNLAEQIRVETYWSGEKAPFHRHFVAKLLWSKEAFYVRFDANQGEPLVVSPEPNLLSKTIELWERDVCEIFVAPDKENFRRYFEFEIAPNGEWLDLEIYQNQYERVTNWDYDSKMESVAKVAESRILMGMKIPWQAFGKRPKPGDVWLGNLFRCVGEGEKRGFLAWSPTKTPEPNFHVPEKFRPFNFET